MAVPEPFLEWSRGESEAQAAAGVARQVERQPEWSRRLAKHVVASEQPEPLQAARCWLQVSSQKRPEQL